MVYVCMYDIAKDKTRTKFAKSMEAVGLRRIQKSVFAGKVPNKVLKPILRTYSEKLEEGDKLFVLSLADRQLEEMMKWGFEEDMNLILQRTRILII